MILKLLSAVLFAFFLGIQPLSVGAETRPSVSDFLSQVQATYDKMQSYSSAGEITSDFSVPGTGRQKDHHSFSIQARAAESVPDRMGNAGALYDRQRGGMVGWRWKFRNGARADEPYPAPRHVYRVVNGDRNIRWSGRNDTRNLLWSGQRHPRGFERRGIRTGRGRGKRPLLRHNEQDSANRNDSVDFQEIAAAPAIKNWTTRVR